MRIDRSVPPNERTGLSTYYHDYKQRTAERTQQPRPVESFRSNRPHPKQNFLEPRSRPESADILQKRVRAAVREYLDQLYYSKQQQHIPIRSSFTPQQYTSYTYVHDQPNNKPTGPKINNNFPGVSGRATLHYDRDKPVLHISHERPTTGRLGESKNERSVRIDTEIRKSNRINTPQPNPQRWQAEATPVPLDKQPHWISHPIIGKPKKRPRVSSAPPSMNKYSYYEQQPARLNTPEVKPMTNRLEEWALTANDYEKQVVYNMLKNVSGPVEGGPSSPPPVPQEAYNILTGKYPAYNTASYPTSSPQRAYSATTKPRKTNSAPLKGMLGLVPSATQMPHRDQRDFRLEGEDTRLHANPNDDRMLKEYLSNMATHRRTSPQSKKFLIVPMHSYPKRKGVPNKDYKCDVSFFQSVRSPFKGHFVIHPDFTSEEVHRKKHVDQMISHFKY